MKIAKFLVAFIASAAFYGTAGATPPGMNVDFAGGGLGKVTFNGKAHADKGMKCNDCHPKVFEMKKGSSKITMAAMNGGKQCGTCHNGTKAFKASDPAKCTTCHVKK